MLAAASRARAHPLLEPATSPFQRRPGDAQRRFSQRATWRSRRPSPRSRTGRSMARSTGQPRDSWRPDRLHDAAATEHLSISRARHRPFRQRFRANCPTRCPRQTNRGRSSPRKPPFGFAPHCVASDSTLSGQLRLSFSKSGSSERNLGFLRPNPGDLTALIAEPSLVHRDDFERWKGSRVRPRALRNCSIPAVDITSNRGLRGQYNPPPFESVDVGVIGSGPAVVESGICPRGVLVVPFVGFPRNRRNVRTRTAPNATRRQSIWPWCSPSWRASSSGRTDDQGGSFTEFSSRRPQSCLAHCSSPSLLGTLKRKKIIKKKTKKQKKKKKKKKRKKKNKKK